MEENIILNKKSNKKKVILLSILLLIVIAGTIGVAYAVYRFQTEGDSSELITGDIYMHYKGQNAGISIENAVPSKTYDKEKYFEFTIEGKNTYTEKDIWYEIDLADGDQPAGRTIRIDDKFLRFRLTEQIGSGQEKTVVNSVGYDDITNKKIWVNKIDTNTNEEIKITYKLYMWISEEVHIGYDDEEKINFDYTTDEWANNVYASIKINIKGDFEEKNQDLRPLPEDLPTNLLERIKKLAYYRDGEIIALDVTDKNNVSKCVSISSCLKKKIEYRYSGPMANNYIYLTDNNNSNELWRIIGIFEDETVGEYIKVVRDTFLSKDVLPTRYIINGREYIIRYSDNEVYWNGFYPQSISEEKNNWSIAGLQYFLNTENDENSNKGYLNYLSKELKSKLVSVKHYLGTVHLSDANGDTPKESYSHERDVENCINNKGNVDNDNREKIESENSGCHVWAGNDATWTGKVSLMYPSDYGFTANEINWNSPLSGESSKPSGTFRDTLIKTTSWMFNTMTITERASWMISPANLKDTWASYWVSGFVLESGTANQNSMYYAKKVLPVLNLSSSTNWISGDGTKENPYKIIAD